MLQCCQSRPSCFLYLPSTSVLSTIPQNTRCPYHVTLDPSHVKDFGQWRLCDGRIRVAHPTGRLSRASGNPQYQRGGGLWFPRVVNAGDDIYFWDTSPHVRRRCHHSLRRHRFPRAVRIPFLTEYSWVAHVIMCPIDDVASFIAQAWILKTHPCVVAPTRYKPDSCDISCHYCCK